MPIRMRASNNDWQPIDIIEKCSRLRPEVSFTVMDVGRTKMNDRHHEVGHIAVCPSTVWEAGGSIVDNIRPYKACTKSYRAKET